MNRKLVGAIGATAALAAAAVAFAGGSSASAPAGSRLDDGAQYLSQAKVSESAATASARRAAKGALNETDLEHRDGRLVYNVDVGGSDVKVDATTGDVVAVDHDD
jgi:uncharacterized membrane protein YkoI